MGMRYYYVFLASGLWVYIFFVGSVDASVKNVLNAISYYEPLYGTHTNNIDYGHISIDFSVSDESVHMSDDKHGLCKIWWYGSFADQKKKSMITELINKINNNRYTTSLTVTPGKKNGDLFVFTIQYDPSTVMICYDGFIDAHNRTKYIKIRLCNKQLLSVLESRSDAFLEIVFNNYIRCFDQLM